MCASGKKNVYYYNVLYRVIHKSVKYFNNSRKVDYATDHGNTYANGEKAL
jgi:hypothetical protein